MQAVKSRGRTTPYLVRLNITWTEKSQPDQSGFSRPLSTRSAWKCLAFPFGHQGGVIVRADFTDFKNAGLPVGIEYERHEFRYCVIEAAAILWNGEFSAVGACGIIMFQAAGPHLAPAGLFILPAAGAPAFEIGTTRPAIQSTASDQIPVDRNIFHGLFLCAFHLNIG